jgi:hypothetical protein
VEDQIMRVVAVSLIGLFVSSFVSGLALAAEPAGIPKEDGGVYQLLWHKVSATVDEGELTETAAGKEGSAKVRLERKGTDEAVVNVTERIRGDESLPDLTFVYNRVVREEGKRKAKK